MKIDLKNIGAVNHADIDLSKNLIVFCGPNNTGKTYIAYTIYGIYKYSYRAFLKDDLVYNVIKSNSNIDEISFTIDTALVKRLLHEKGEYVLNNLYNIFASEQSFFDKSKINITINDNEIIKRINNLTIDSKYKIGNSFYNLKKEKNNNVIKILNTKELVNDGVQNNPDEYVFDISSRVITFYILTAIFNKPYITPTERTAINIFSKELTSNRNEIVDKLLGFKGDDLKDSPLRDAQRYSLPIRDSLEIAEDLSNKQKNTSAFAFLADEIEKDILKGKINITSSGDMQFNFDENNSSSLNINLSSSVVKSLSNLVFYFRHIAAKNDFIIIDEPELNLHPDNQIIIARLIAKIVNNGFKVLISTHSDYIIKEINNLIRLNSAGDHSRSLMEKYGYKKTDLLDKDNVGVYLFKEGEATGITVDEFGFEISTIQQENSKLAEISESIYFELFDKED